MNIIRAKKLAGILNECQCNESEDKISQAIESVKKSFPDSSSDQERQQALRELGLDESEVEEAMSRIFDDNNDSDTERYDAVDEIDGGLVGAGIGVALTMTAVLTSMVKEYKRIKKDQPGISEKDAIKHAFSKVGEEISNARR